MTAMNEIEAGFLRAPDDLGLLTLVKPEAVKHWVAELNAMDPKALKGKKLVAAVGTGGTIAMKTEDGIRRPDLDFAGVFGFAHAGLNESFCVKSLDMCRIDSSQMDYRHVRELAIVMTYVWRHVTVPFIGFLVLHGTDTLAYTSAAMSLMMGQGLPFSIVYTAAQKPIQEPMSDAPMNLRNALYLLESLHARDMAEVVVAVGDQAVLATSSVKVDDTMANAFDAPLHRYIATFNRLEYPVRLADWLNPKRKVAFDPTIWEGDFSHTLVVKSSLGLDPEMTARQVEDPRVQAVLLFSYGAGTVYKGVSDAIMEPARKKNIPTFVVSPVNTEYKVDYESGLEMVKSGVVPLYMTLPAALAKIEIALRMHAGDVRAMSRFMTTNYVGEIPSERSRFVPVK